MCGRVLLDSHAASIRREHDAQRFWLQVISALADAAAGDVVERVE
jgi:hypothetical protein